MHTSYDMTFFPFIYERIKFLFPFAMTIFFSLGTYRIIFSGIKKNVDTDFKTIFFLVSLIEGKLGHIFTFTF